MQIRGNHTLHLLDRYIGVPLLAALSVLRRKRVCPTKIRKIGLLKAGAIGDTVLLTGPIADLRAAFPHAQIILFAGESNYEMAKLLDGVTQVVRVPSGNPWQGIAAMRSVPVDLLFDFGQWSRLEALYAAAANSSFTIGFRTTGQRRHFCYDQTVDHSAHQHEIENYRDLVRAAGASAGNPPFLASAPAKFGELANAPYVVCHPWAGGKRRELKQWPSAQWLKLMTEIAEWGFYVVVTGGPVDRCENEKLISELPEPARSVTKNAAGASLQRTIEILAGSALTVSVNTGVMHIAAALGIPVVGLHGPTSAKRWGPLGKHSVAIDSTLDSSGYLNLGWEYPEHPPPCMESIDYETVRDACRHCCEEHRAALSSLQSAEPLALGAAASHQASSK